MKERADLILTRRGLAETRQKAQALIMAGLVFSGEQRVEKPGQMLDADSDLVLHGRMAFVSRGGMKLQEALAHFRIDPSGRAAADLGSSTGGFTDCLIQNGAARVYAVDVDTRQIDWRLRKDPRVVLIQKNARYLEKADFPEAIDIVTMDLAFISVLKVLPAVGFFAPRASVLALVKPQFEADRRKVGKRGVIRSPEVHEEVLNRVLAEAVGSGFMAEGVFKPSVRGQKGNQEFFVLWTRDGDSNSQDRFKTFIKEAVWDEKD